ncbi:hypothetical protein CYMTET_22092 [Cymbomonas tetramitiformis]|uniref:Uncharacterized protein n=1 Tax=Cymbomonas tetramitiformis TaxID=36881 RepID=A0AAE0L2M6_9CHLO|nr:hypothetical protein CYMTET_22092 [Cymbomonas tetramitiformis]
MFGSKGCWNPDSDPVSGASVGTRVEVSWPEAGLVWGGWERGGAGGGAVVIEYFDGDPAGSGSAGMEHEADGSSFLRLDCASTTLAVEVVKMSMLSVVHQLKREVARAGEGGSALWGKLRGGPWRGVPGDPEGLGEAGWTWLRGLSIDEYAVSDYPSLMAPKRMRGLFTECAMVALRRVRVDTEDVDAYKLFFLLPRLILQPVQKGEKKGVAQVIKERCVRFLRGDWEELHAEGRRHRAIDGLRPRQMRSRRREVEEDRRRELQAQALELDEVDDFGNKVWPIACGGVLRELVAKAVLERVQERHPAVVICAFLDDAFFMHGPSSRCGACVWRL